MLWPRASGMTSVGSPGQRAVAARSADRCRHAAKTCRHDADNHDAGNRACAAAAGTACGTGGGASAAACRASSDAIAVAAGVATVSPVMPGTTLGFSHHCSPQAGRPARNPFTLPPNATMARDSSGQSGCPGPMPRRRHIQAIALPNGPRIDAASACAEPGGRSGRSCHHGGSRTERRGRSGEQRLQQEEDQQGEEVDEPLRRVRGRVRTGPICIGGIGFGRSGGRGGHSGRTITTGREASQALFPG